MHHDNAPSGKNIEKYLAFSFNTYCGDVDGSKSLMAIPPSLCNDLLALFNMGDLYGEPVPEGLKIARKYIPVEWFEWADTGIIQLQEVGASEIIVRHPYPFLIQYMKKQVTFFEKEDLEDLFAQLRARYIDWQKGRGYCFPFAVAFELLLPHSALTKAMMGMLGTEYKRDAQIKAPIALFKSDAEVPSLDSHQIGISIDPEKKLTKLGDIHIPCVKNLEGQMQTMAIRGELKYVGADAITKDQLSHAHTKLTHDCDKFFRKADTHLSSPQVIVFFSWIPLLPYLKGGNSSKPKKEVLEFLSRKDKLFVIFDAIKNIKTVLNFQHLVNPSKEITHNSFKQNFFSSTEELYTESALNKLELTRNDQ